jgi:hypothetical protein
MPGIYKKSLPWVLKAKVLKFRGKIFSRDNNILRLAVSGYDKGS